MNTLFGLDIGSSTMKAVWLEKRGQELRFRSAISALTPPKGMLSDASLDQEEIAQTIRKMVIDAKIGPRSVNLALPDNHVFSKVIDMPLLNEKELSSAIYWEAEQHIPVPLDTVNLDWRVIKQDEETAKSPRMQVLLIGAPLGMLKKYQMVFELAGIGIASVETETLSVLRATGVNQSFPNSLIVNIGGLATSIAIVQSGSVVFLYTAPVGGIAINRSLAAEFNFSLTQAEEYKKTYGLDEKNFGGKIKKVIEPIIQSLVTEIKKAMTFYADKYKESSPISQIMLSGGTAKLPGLIPIFVEETGIETAITNPWKTLDIQAIPQELVDYGPEYTVAIGLAMKGL